MNNPPEQPGADVQNNWMSRVDFISRHAPLLCSGLHGDAVVCNLFFGNVLAMKY